MPVILIFRKIKVLTYTKDHLPPHVHVVGPGFEVVVRLDNLRATSKTASERLQRLATELVRSNLELCWEKWNEIHGET